MKKKDKLNNYNKYFFIILIACFSLFLLVFMECESDYFWHIKVGEYIFHNGIIKKDVFSWSTFGKEWISHEWLFEIYIYILKILFSKFHLIIYGFSCIFLLLSILFLSNESNYLKNIPFSLLWLSFAIIFSSYMQGRPNLISFNLLAITMLLLFDNYKNKNSKRIYFLPFISILWSNVHGGSSNLVYLFCLIFYLCSFFEFDSAKVISKKISTIQRKRFFIVFFLCIFATNLNIHGYKMLLYPYQNMLDSTMLMSIQEWQPIDLNVISHYPYVLLTSFIFFILLFSKKKINFLDLILFLLSIFLGFKSIRFCSYTYIIMSFIIFNYIEPRKEDKGTRTLLVFCSIVFLAIFSLNYKKIIHNTNKEILSLEIIDVLKEEKPLRLFNAYNIGGELIYNNIPVFIDGRADLYSNDYLNDYLVIQNTSKNFELLIAKYDFDYYLVYENSNISEYLKNNNSYNLIFEDTEYLLYKKN